MITQIILDAITYWIAGAIYLIPQMPAQIAELPALVSDGMITLGNALANLSPLVPFFTFRALFDWWLILLGFWVATRPLALLFWLIGRSKA